MFSSHYFVVKKTPLWGETPIGDQREQSLRSVNFKVVSDCLHKCSKTKCGRWVDAFKLPGCRLGYCSTQRGKYLERVIKDDVA